jgi:hypothetical protein
MNQQNTGQKPSGEQGKTQTGSESVLSDKEKFAQNQTAGEDLKHMGEKTKEGAKQK